MGKPAKFDDEIFKIAKGKLGDAIKACNARDHQKLVRLCECLWKMRALELKGDEGDWGASLGDPPPGASA